MTKLIDGKKIAEKIKDEITKEIFKLGQRPNLAIILLEGRSDSELYVSLKEREAKKVGIDTHLYKMSAEIDEQEILDVINFLNDDDTIDAILVQLPLPEKFDTDKIIKSIKAEKDVDGFHPENIENLKNNKSIIVSPVFGAVEEILKEIKVDIINKKVSILSNSKIFRDNLAIFLSRKGSLTNSYEKINSDILNSDILISALGKPHHIKKEMIKKDSIIIDIGITKDGKIVKGDVDLKDVEAKCAYITPVPGGVGPLTIAMTFQNTLTFFKNKKL